ncbi:uncharacterized protein LOC118431764 isoform X1 [Branchiostoma floridae]|uniref:Uncharacterized protein LOC118431764 isoform X1 n=1 Tax=Branchiostoma floridae TaxID=7739 RepID=A0A9J7MGR8_BRAFL|nr:uncharacterized protein LOC118431764 isoform X1 [Branchiostoma floridae]
MEKVVRRVCESRWGALLIGAVIGSCVTQLFTAAPRVPHTTELRTSSSRSPAWLLRTQESQSKSVWSEYIKDPQSKEEKLPRKILLDCGANVASTVQLFRETYPDGQDFIIHSFEIDERLAPFFAPYPNHVLHCPTGVSIKDGNMTAYSESAWSPDKGKNNRRDMQWGGGSLFAFDDEKADTETGGRRKLSHHRTVPTVDLSRWIQENTAVEDYVIFKLDVEGAEYDILKKMLEDGTFKWVDKYYGEFHRWQPVTGWDKEEKANLVSDVKTKGKPMISWAAEVRNYGDFNTMHPPLASESFVGSPGTVYSSCSAPPSGTPRLALAVLVGMNVKAAHKLVQTIAAHSSRMPVTLFLYGDFVETFPELVTEWAKTFTIGMRENQPFPLGHFTMQASPWIRTGLVSAIQRLSEVDIQTAYYLPENVTDTVINEAKSRGLRIIQPTARFPPTDDKWLLSVENYYKYRDVERTPKALRVITQQLDNKGGIVSLDSDHPDSYMSSVFLMDYLVEKSGYNLVSIVGCLE